MTTTTDSVPIARHPSESPLSCTISEQRFGVQRRRSMPKITGRKLRLPRKFVITDVPDALQQPGDNEEDNNNYGNEINSEDFTASSSSVRKGKTQVKGRFTITDLSPELYEASSEREYLSASLGPTSACDVPRRQSSRRLPTRRPFQSAGDVRSSIGLTKPKLVQPQQTSQQEAPFLASFQRLAASSSSPCSTGVGNPMSNQITHNMHKQRQTVLDHHLEFLEKETNEMRLVLENMVTTNAQWIEALTSAGLVSATTTSRSIDELNPPVPSPLEKQVRDVEKAYAELQTKHETVCIKAERLEVKNAMLEIRLQQQVNRSTMLRSQLDKLTQYTEKLIGESLEPTLHDYNLDLNSIMGEYSETNSPTADDTTSGEYGFRCDVVKPRRQRWRDVDEECMSDTSTEGSSTRKTLSPPHFDEDNNCYLSEMELTITNFPSSNNRSSAAALDSLLDDQCSQLCQSFRSNDRVNNDSVIDALDSLAGCPSVINNGDDEYNVGNQNGLSSRFVNEQKSQLLKHSNSVASLNYSTVSSNSSLAGYGLNLATIAQYKSGYFASVASASLFGPHPKPCPNASNQQNAPRDDKFVHNVLSLENLRYHDCQSLNQSSTEEKIALNPTPRREFTFFTSNKATSLPGTNNVSKQTLSTGSLFQRFALRRC